MGKAPRGRCKGRAWVSLDCRGRRTCRASPSRSPYFPWRGCRWHRRLWCRFGGLGLALLGSLDWGDGDDGALWFVGGAVALALLRTASGAEPQRSVITVVVPSQLTARLQLLVSAPASGLGGDIVQPTRKTIGIVSLLSVFPPLLYQLRRWGDRVFWGHREMRVRRTPGASSPTV